MDDTKTIRKVERSPKGLVDALFDSLDAMNAGTISHEEAYATAHTARAIVSVVKLEIDAVRLSESLGKKVELKALPGFGQRADQPVTT